MRIQHQIKRTLNGRVDELRVLIADRHGASRTAVADVVCERFGFLDARAKPQRSSCLKALRELAQGGRIELPASRLPHWKGPSPRRLNAAVPLPAKVPSSIDQVQELRIELVMSPGQQRIWNELMIREHSLGECRLVGRQLRYLVCSKSGYLGAAGFSSSARALRQRDAWIGWDEETRRQHLDKIVCLSRLLIRPAGVCANLASRVLAMLVRAFPADFAARYGYHPWLLESFVDCSRHEGICYRAANWQRIGTSCGRGRQDREHRASKSIKDIYVYELQSDFRHHIGLADSQRDTALAPGEGLDAQNWAQNELGDAQLGDARLTRRLISIAQIKGAAPGTPFLDAVAGDRAASAGYYRFIDAPEESHISMENILAPHRERTMARMKGQKKVLCIHDTTDLSYATLTACEGLGVIGKNQTATESRGLRLHTSFVVSAEEGLPLGIWNARCYAPQLKPEHQGKDPRYIPLEEKETCRWVDSLVECMAHNEERRGTRVVHVMDREGDFFDLFDRWKSTPKRDDLVIRAKHNRKHLPAEGEVIEADKEEKTDEKIFEVVARRPLAASVEVDVPRKSGRAKKGKKAEQPSRAKRRAVLSLRWMKVQIAPPTDGLSSKRPPVEVWLLHACEETPPADGSKSIEWMLLTSIAIENEQSAIEVLGYYAKRWRIEDWHRILKTCCRVEEPAHRDSECLMRLVAINMVIAWRIQLMTLLGREVPELPLELLFSDLEIEVMRRYCNSQRVRVPATLGEGVLLVAKLGGYLGRKHDGPPGAEVLWRGSRKLSIYCECAAFLAASGETALP
ncbi:MAG: IS4 family transposase [Acidobacteria bacterium]|nr:IS4 family transposase [Acidobacteriota bacterium]